LFLDSLYVRIQQEPDQKATSEKRCVATSETKGTCELRRDESLFLRELSGQRLLPAGGCESPSAGTTAASDAEVDEEAETVLPDCRAMRE
jgi:hypothetical protein